jgi:hypothetical protein
MPWGTALERGAARVSHERRRVATGTLATSPMLPSLCPHDCAARSRILAVDDATAIARQTELRRHNRPRPAWVPAPPTAGRTGQRGPLCSGQDQSVMVLVGVERPREVSRPFMDFCS